MVQAARAVQVRTHTPVYLEGCARVGEEPVHRHGKESLLPLTHFNRSLRPAFADLKMRSYLNIVCAFGWSWEAAKDRTSWSFNVSVTPAIVFKSPRTEVTCGLLFARQGARDREKERTRVSVLLSLNHRCACVWFDAADCSHRVLLSIVGMGAGFTIPRTCPCRCRHGNTCLLWTTALVLSQQRCPPLPPFLLVLLRVLVLLLHHHCPAISALHPILRSGATPDLPVLWSHCERQPAGRPRQDPLPPSISSCVHPDLLYL